MIVRYFTNNISATSGAFFSYIVGLFFPSCVVTMLVQKQNSLSVLESELYNIFGTVKNINGGVKFYYRYSGRGIFSSHLCLISIYDNQLENFFIEIKFVSIQRLIVPIFLTLIFTVLIREYQNSLFETFVHVFLLIAIQHAVIAGMIFPCLREIKLAILSVVDAR